MAIAAQTYQKELPRIKKQIEKAYAYMRNNYSMWHMQRKFIFQTALTDSDKQILRERGMPEIEFNNIMPYLSRLLGEWWDQDPDIACSSKNGDMIDPNLLHFIEGYIRNIVYVAKEDSTINNLLQDTITGGFSDLKVDVDYVSNDEFQQCLNLSKVNRPCLVYWDPVSSKRHKGDANFWGEVYPKTKEEFLSEFGKDIDISEIKFYKSVDGFNWSYKGQKNEDILLVVDHYEIKKKRVKLLELSNGKSMLEDEYKDHIEKNQIMYSLIPPPAITRTRWTHKTHVCRYVLIEDKIISYEETYFDMPNYVFADGNSAKLQNGENGEEYQFTPSYFYYAMGVQRLRNFAVQNLANELENMNQSRLTVAIESIPDQEEYMKSLRNPQSSSPIIYHSRDKNDPSIQLPPPQTTPRVPIPQEVTNTLTMTEQFTQSAFGSYDAALGINSNQLSGRAIEKGASQSNASSMPYLNNAMIALNRAAEIILNMIPKIHKTPATIPIVQKDGTRSFVKVNQQDGSGLQLNYDPKSLNIKVEAGVSFKVQKSSALETIFKLMEASPTLAQFIGTACVDDILDNVDCRGVDSMKAKWPQYQQQMAQQAAQQPNPEQIKAQALMAKIQVDQAKVQNEMKKSQQDAAIEMAKIQVGQEQAETDRIRVLLEAHQAQQDNVIKLEKSQTERAVHALDFATEQMKHHHNAAKDMIELHLKRVGMNRGVTANA